MITDSSAAGNVGHHPGKRLFDLLVAIGLAPVAIPVCLIAAIPILFEAGASPFFRQVRVGEGPATGVKASRLEHGKGRRMKSASPHC